MTQLLAHLFGDYILQSDWMANNKTKRSWPAFVHALLYSLCFVPLIWFHGRVPLASWVCWGWIFVTHFLIDRFRLARYVVWAKNWLGPRKWWYRNIPGGKPTWSDVAREGEPLPRMADGYYIFHAPTPPLWACPTGYPPTTPAWLSTWLLIIADNTLHLAINYVALTYL